ncbi:MAG: DsbC family protein [Gammaproteobacteria bacterium]|nr:DsbC family protein [Gammaproteobacteria bacterium]NND58947.1 DsbC family protein [Gammaproteobacteria bacterium]
MYKTILALAALAVVGSAHAESVCKPENIQARLPGVESDSVRDTPLDGVCEIAFGPQIVYVSPDAQYLIRGDIVEIESNVNLTDQRRAKARVKVMNDLKADDMIVFAPEDEARHVITVFTDIDCGYCRKLHREMADLHKNGIQVQYLFFPRSGPGSASWQKAQNVWCSDNRNDALTAAKNGESVKAEPCESAPIQEHYAMGQMVGLRGTPAVITETGELISGYLPADAMLTRLESFKTATMADK